MSDDDDHLSVRILVDIREKVEATNVRVDHLEQRLDGRINQLEKRVDRLEVKLETKFDAGLAALERQLGRQIVESEIRTSTAVNELAGPLHDVRDMLRDRLDLRDRVERCERDIGEIKHRLG